jgi:hypothetical protein
MRLLESRIDGGSESVRLTGRIETRGGLVELWFEYPAAFAAFVRNDADVFVPAMLPVAMMRGEPVEVEQPVSRELYRNLDELQDVFATWYPREMRRVETRFSAVVIKSHEETPATLAYFSAGVDSFYTALKRRYDLQTSLPEITHLLYMRGVETPLSNDSRVTVDVMRRIAAEMGYPLLAGATNLRDVFNIDWGDYYCGAGLAAIGLSLSRGVGHVLIPSSSSYRSEDLYPWSTHPLTDRLWSTEYCRIRQCGCEATRAEKIDRVVSRDPVALKYLRVCTVNRGEFVNCGQCPKCVRTIITLAMLDRLRQAPTFREQFPSRLVRQVDFGNPVEYRFMCEVLALAREKGYANDVTRAIKRRLRAQARRQAILQWLANTPASPIVAGCRSAYRRLTRYLRRKK